MEWTFFEAGNIQDLVDKIELMLDDSNLRQFCIRNGYETAKKNTRDKIEAKIFDAINKRFQRIEYNFISD